MCCQNSYQREKKETKYVKKSNMHSHGKPHANTEPSFGVFVWCGKRTNKSCNKQQQQEKKERKRSQQHCTIMAADKFVSGRVGGGGGQPIKTNCCRSLLSGCKRLRPPPPSSNPSHHCLMHHLDNFQCYFCGGKNCIICANDMRFFLLVCRCTLPPPLYGCMCVSIVFNKENKTARKQNLKLETTLNWLGN